MTAAAAVIIRHPGSRLAEGRPPSNGCAAVARSGRARLHGGWELREGNPPPLALENGLRPRAGARRPMASFLQEDAVDV
eukprot:10483027-Alexandrium_andersonii.AAC.1